MVPREGGSGAVIVNPFATLLFKRVLGNYIAYVRVRMTHNVEIYYGVGLSLVRVAKS